LLYKTKARLLHFSYRKWVSGLVYGRAVSQIIALFSTPIKSHKKFNFVFFKLKIKWTVTYLNNYYMNISIIIKRCEVNWQYFSKRRRICHLTNKTWTKVTGGQNHRLQQMILKKYNWKLTWSPEIWNKVLIQNVCEAEKCYKHLQICTNRNPKRFGAFGHVLVAWITKNIAWAKLLCLSWVV